MRILTTPLPSLPQLLEQLGERDVTSVEQAVLYRLSVHAGWRAAAMRFLEGVPDASAMVWTDEYPAVAIVALARMAAEFAAGRPIRTSGVVPTPRRIIAMAMILRGFLWNS